MTVTFPVTLGSMMKFLFVAFAIHSMNERMLVSCIFIFISLLLSSSCSVLLWVAGEVRAMLRSIKRVVAFLIRAGILLVLS